MREHALPQDVTGYKFHIIGNMTLKQFVEVGAGCVIAFIVYQTNLYTFIKFPLMAFAAGLGAMLAFVPIEERPLDQWIINLFRVLYRPTQYYWKRDPKIPEPFLYQPTQTTTSAVGEIDLSPARRQRVKEYLRSITTTPQPADQLDVYTDQRVGEVMQFFQAEGMQLPEQTSLTPNPVAEEAVDQLSFVGRASGTENQLETEVVDQNNDPLLVQENHVADQVLDLFENPSTTEQAVETPAQPSDTLSLQDAASIAGNVQLTPNQPLDAVGTAQVAAHLNTLEAPTVQVHNVFSSDDSDPGLGHVIEEEGGSFSAPATPTTGDTSAFSQSAQDLRRPVVVPEMQNISVKKSIAVADLSDPAAAKVTQEVVDTTAVNSTPIQADIQPLHNLQHVTSNTNLPFPDKPDTPNKVVGMVIDGQNQPVPNAIVEILTPTGLPARAVKTNPVGQFFIMTPLSNGDYVVRVDKDGLQFPDQQLSLQNQIIDPLELRAV